MKRFGITVIEELSHMLVLNVIFDGEEFIVDVAKDGFIIVNSDELIELTTASNIEKIQKYVKMNLNNILRFNELFG